MKRRMFAVVLGLVLTLVVSSAALAHFCTNSSKADGAGSIGTLTLGSHFEFVSFEPNEPFTRFYDPATGNFTKDVAGFITIVIGDQSFEIFTRTMLPDGAINAGPDDDYCDGIGIDLALACVGLEAPPH